MRRQQACIAANREDTFMGLFPTITPGRFPGRCNSFCPMGVAAQGRPDIGGNKKNHIGTEGAYRLSTNLKVRWRLVGFRTSINRQRQLCERNEGPSANLSPRIGTACIASTSRRQVRRHHRSMSITGRAARRRSSSPTNTTTRAGLFAVPERTARSLSRPTPGLPAR